MSERIRVYERKLREEIHRDLTATQVNGGNIEIKVPCTCCEDPPLWSATKMFPPPAVAGKLRKIGWTIGRHPKCPKHNKGAGDKTPANDQAAQVEVEIAEVLPPAIAAPIAGAPIVKEPAKTPATRPIIKAQIAPVKEVEIKTMATAAPVATTKAPAAADEIPTASATVRAAKRLTIQWLDESFDVEEGRYKGEINDGTIAQETGLSEVQVKAMREDLYGPLKEPKEIAEVRDDLKRITEKYESNNRTIETTLARIKTQQEDSARQFADDVAKLTKRLERLISTNNWPS